MVASFKSHCSQAQAKEKGVRLDKWLWVARLFKTRALASEEIGKGRVQVNNQVAKASREVRLGDRIEVRQNQLQRTIVVRGLSQLRGSASVAGLLFEETAESITQREQVIEQHRMAPEPANSQDSGRPTKRDRRQLNDWSRWSASVEPSE